MSKSIKTRTRYSICGSDYSAQEPRSTASLANDEAMLNAYIEGKDLYGFYSVDELECFKMLISVSGVGPKVAVALLSEFDADRIMLLIASGDSKSLTAAALMERSLSPSIFCGMMCGTMAAAMQD